MNLVVIYGPPAAGKLSVARELSRMTGYKLFHNHASLDFVGTIFDFGTDVFSELVVRFRKEMIEEAAKRGIDVIFTSAWVKGYKKPVIDELKSLVERHGGRVCFVYLYASREELLKRSEEGSRAGFGKIRDRKKLDEFLSTYHMPKEAPIEGSLMVENTKITPAAAAEAIAKHFLLSRT